MNRPDDEKTPGVESDQWLGGSSAESFQLWKSRDKAASKVAGNEEYLMRKYANIWLRKCGKLHVDDRCREEDINITSISGWLKVLMFSPSSRQTRSLICSVLDYLAQVIIILYFSGIFRFDFFFFKITESARILFFL